MRSLGRKEDNAVAFGEMSAVQDELCELFAAWAAWPHSLMHCVYIYVYIYIYYIRISPLQLSSLLDQVSKDVSRTDELVEACSAFSLGGQICRAHAA